MACQHVSRWSESDTASPRSVAMNSAHANWTVSRSCVSKALPTRAAASTIDWCRPSRPSRSTRASASAINNTASRTFHVSGPTGNGTDCISPWEGDKGEKGVKGIESEGLCPFSPFSPGSGRVARNRRAMLTRSLTSCPPRRGEPNFGRSAVSGASFKSRESKSQENAESLADPLRRQVLSCQCPNLGPGQTSRRVPQQGEYVVCEWVPGRVPEQAEDRVVSVRPDGQRRDEVLRPNDRRAVEDGVEDREAKDVGLGAAG